MTIAIHVDQERDESMLGASEAAAVLGLSRYQSPIDIWRKHRGLPVQGDDKENEAAWWGNALEPVVRGHYAIQSKRIVLVPTASSKLDGWLRCTPDGVSFPCSTPQVVELSGAYHEPDIWHGIYTDTVFNVWVPSPDEFADHGGLQVKTCSAYLRDDWATGAPAAYEVQCRVEMAVTGLLWVDVVCLCGGQQYLGPWRIYRDLELERRILEPLHDFWTLVQSGVEPSVDHTEGWKLHVSEKLAKAEPVAVQADDEMRGHLLDWQHTRKVLAKAKRDEEHVKNRILQRLANAGAMRIEAGEMGRVIAYRTPAGTWALKAPASWREGK